MKYKNAAEVLPVRLLRELQCYSGGDLLYIPRAGVKAGWGAENGSRDYYLERNQMIRILYREGKSVSGLAVSTIKKIIYH